MPWNRSASNACIGAKVSELRMQTLGSLSDDVERVPFNRTLTPRPLGSPSIGAGSHRPFTPTRFPSFRARTPVGRPQSPSLPSGAQTPTVPHPSSGLARSESGLSPSPSVVGLAAAASPYSSAGSPVTSPEALSAKAAAFNPSPQPSNASAAPRPTAFSPSDPWKDVPSDPVRAASPFGAVGAVGMARTGSNLAIASPLFNDQSSPFHSPIGTPVRATVKMPDIHTPPTFSRTSSRSYIPDDDDDDEFSPFGSGVPKFRPQALSALNTGAKAFEPGDGWGASKTLSDSGQSIESYGSGGSSFPPDSVEEDDAGTGMTPLDVLASVFSTVPRYDLEDALHRAGYEFEGAMAILVANHSHPRSGASTPQRVSSPRPLVGVGGRGTLALPHAGPRDGYFQQGGRTVSGGMSPGLPGSRTPSGAMRMCRYFLAGECRRSDCRFSHDIDRALCRFWLRGHCAKGPNCEFLHQLPTTLDPNALSTAMSHVELSNDGSARQSPVSQRGQGGDEFPDLVAARLGRSNPRFDPTRNRFANAVKRAVPMPQTLPSVQVTGARHGVFNQSLAPGPDARIAPAAVPRQSQRIKLRPPTLLPTVTTGVAANEQYMKARATAIRLGNARNACLARAADAFRRGDGAAAKRFSREGKSLNEKMLSESAEAAQALVRERRADAQRSVRERDVNWSDDPSDRSNRGKECAGGLGVILGVASKQNVIGGEALSSEDRTECMLDLHTLHGPEGSEIMGQFLAELERERYRGLGELSWRCLTEEEILMLAYVLVGEEKHVGQQDVLRGASKIRLGATVKQSLAEWGYAWNETAGILCIDPCRV